MADTLDPTRSYSFDEIAARGEPRFFPDNPDYYKRLALDFAETEMGRKLYEGQVETYMIEVMAYLLQVRGAELQFATIQRLLPFATGIYLDALAARLDTYRLQPSRARLDVTFRLAAERSSSVAVPAGTRVRADSTATAFLTREDLLIQPGVLSGTVAAESDAAGDTGNGVGTGTALAILDPVAGVAAAEAASPSGGGAAEESDDRLRRRAALAWETISRGGPREGYRRLVLDAHQDILDVAVVRPQPCDIQLYILTEVMPPSQEVLGAALAAADPVSGRPEGDEVFSLAAEPVDIDVSLMVWADGDRAHIRDLAEVTARGVFAAWRRTLGARLATAAVTSPVKALPGVVEATVAGFGYRTLQRHQYAVLRSISVIVASGDGDDEGTG